MLLLFPWAFWTDITSPGAHREQHPSSSTGLWPAPEPGSEIHCPLMCPSAPFFRLQLSFHVFPMNSIVSISLLQISELARRSHLELLFLDCDKWATSQHFLPFRLQGHHLTCPKPHLLFPTRKSPSYFCYCMYSISFNGISPGPSFVNCKGQRDLWMLYSNLLVFCQEIPCHLSEDPASSLKLSSFGCEIFLTVGALGDFLHRKFLHYSWSNHFKTSS